ncbi:MAG: BTAD domain-containing putative transcriptional regulator [Caldilineaceae bacterium]
MTTLHLYLFGPPRVELDGVTIHVERRKVLALLAYLAVSPQRHSRDVLATLLWPGYDQSEARAHLRRTLSNLTSAIGKEWLEISRQHIGMARRPGLWVDVVSFEEGLTHHHPAPNDGISDAAAQLGAWGKVTELYTDDFLRGFSLSDSADFDDWQIIQAEQLRQKLVVTMQTLVQGYSALGASGYDAALAYAQRWLALDPLHELAHRYLMQLYTWRGDRVAALGQYQECVRLLREELGVEPEAATQELYTQIRTGSLASDVAVELSLTPAATPSIVDLRPPPNAAPAGPTLPAQNLPSQFTTFYGRETELEQIQTLLTGAARLVTIVGESGIGKSRLAVAAAHVLLEHFANRIWFVSLAGFDAHFGSETDNSLQQGIASAISETLGLNSGMTDDLAWREHLLAGIPSAPLLLVLDNFEHALPAAELVMDMLQHLPDLHVLITSTAPLLLQAEHVIRLAGLPLPPPAHRPEEERLPTAAVQLFMARTQQHTPSFSADPESFAAIVQICELVAGSPLGIELAAAWTEYFTCAEIATALQQQDLDLLTVSHRDIPERHRSLRQVFTYAWSLLEPGQQRVLAQLSVFHGAIERAAALAVIDGSLPDLVALYQKSLLSRLAPGRFEMHRLLRSFAGEKLAQMDPMQETQAQHAAYFLVLVREQEGRLLGPDAATALRTVQLNLENIQTAWRWATDHAEWELLGGSALGLVRYYQRKGLYYEGLNVLGYAVQRVRQLRQGTTPDASNAEIGAAEQLLDQLMALLLRRRRRHIPNLDALTGHRD